MCCTLKESRGNFPFRKKKKREKKMKLGWQIVCLNEVWYDHTVCVISFHPAVWCSGEMTLTAGIARETRCNLYVGAVDG